MVTAGQGESRWSTWITGSGSWWGWLDGIVRCPWGGLTPSCGLHHRHLGWPCLPQPGGLGFHGTLGFT